jgi:hypothetical protein
MTVARADAETKDSMKSRVKQMAWSNEYLNGCFFIRHSRLTPVRGASGLIYMRSP